MIRRFFKWLLGEPATIPAHLRPAVGEIWVEKVGSFYAPSRMVIKSAGEHGVHVTNYIEKGPNSPPEGPGFLMCYDNFFAYYKKEIQKP